MQCTATNGVSPVFKYLLIYNGKGGQTFIGTGTYSSISIRFNPAPSIVSANLQLSGNVGHATHNCDGSYQLWGTISLKNFQKCTSTQTTTVTMTLFPKWFKCFYAFGGGCSTVAYCNNASVSFPNASFGFWLFDDGHVSSALCWTPLFIQRKSALMSSSTHWDSQMKPNQKLGFSSSRQAIQGAPLEFNHQEIQNCS